MRGSDAEGARSSSFYSIPLKNIPHSGTIAAAVVTRYTVTRYDHWGNTMAAAERMRAMRERRHARGLRELRLVVPDARSKAIRRRVAREVAGWYRAREVAALGWIEAVSEFDRG